MNTPYIALMILTVLVSSCKLPSSILDKRYPKEIRKEIIGELDHSESVIVLERFDHLINNKTHIIIASENRIVNIKEGQFDRQWYVNDSLTANISFVKSVMQNTSFEKDSNYVIYCTDCDQYRLSAIYMDSSGFIKLDSLYSGVSFWD